MAPKKFAAVGLQLIILILIASIARSQPPRTPPPLSALDTFAALNTVAAVPTTHSVSTAEQLWTALEEVSQRDLGILIAEDMDLTSWPTGITVEIPPGRIVALRSTLSSLPDLATSMNALANAGGKLLNFDNRAAIFRIDPDALLAFSGLHITGVPPKSLYLQDPTNSAQPLPYTLATFPSVLAGVKSGIMHNFTTVDYYPDIDCSEETLNEVVFRSGIALRNASAAGIVPGAAAVYLLGAGMFRFPVLDPLQGNSTVGDALSFVNNTVRNCINGIEADGGGGGNGGLPVWAWVLIALGILFAVTLVLKVCFVKLYRHRRRRRELHLRRRPHPLATIPPATLSLSATLYLEGKALVVADSLVADQMDLSAAATMNIDVAALKKLRDAWKDRIGRVHGLEFEAMVGRGAFGAVYKSKWRGNTVATKLIEHTIDSKMTFYIQREAVLATTCSHPNLVMTYKVATAGISDLEKLPHFLEVSAEEAAAAAAAGAATAAGEGTEQDEKRADGLEIAEEIELVRLSGDEDAGPSGSRYAAAAARPEIAPQAEEEDEEAEWCLKESSDYYFKTHRTDKSISDLEAGKIGGGGGGRQAGGSAGSLRKIPEDLVATLIIMEYCDLGSVREALYSSRAYDIPGCSRDPISLLRTLLDVALGLDYLHNVARVVHGDVKPGNVMLKSVGNTRRGWMAKLVDFGAARALENGISPLALGSRPGGIATGGTTSYMSHDLIMSGISTPATDAYAFGVLMFEVWCGTVPYTTEQKKKMGYAEVAPPFETPEGMPPAYKSLMVRCYSRNSLDRPSMATVIDELRAISRPLIEEIGKDEIERRSKFFLQTLRDHRKA